MERRRGFSALCEPEKLDRVERIVQAVTNHSMSKVARLFDDEGMESLRAAVKYARSRGLGLMEASEVVTPIADTCHSNYDNLRDHFVGRMEP